MTWDIVQLAVNISLVVIMWNLNGELKEADKTIADLRWKVDLLKKQIDEKAKRTAT